MIEKFHVSKNLFDKTAEYIVGTTTYNYTISGLDSSKYYTCSTNFERISGINTASVYFNGGSSDSNGVWSDSPRTFKPNSNGEIVVYIRYRGSAGAPEIYDDVMAGTIWVMVNEGSSPQPFEPYGDTWNSKSYAKIVDTTQQVTSFPVVVRPMENTLPSWTIKGNMSQSGTPTPQNPITPSECGEKSRNLWSDTWKQGGISDAGDVIALSTRVYAYADVISGNEYSFTSSKYIKSIYAYKDTEKVGLILTTSPGYVRTYSFTIPDTANKIGVSLCNADNTNISPSDVSNVMLNTGSTALPYEPYGYKLDIKSGSTTTPVYLGQVESTRQIKKLVLTGGNDENWSITNTSKVLYLAVSDFLKEQGTICYCTHYETVNNVSSADDVNDGECTFNDHLNWLYIKDSNYTSAQGFKNYLAAQYAAGTPVCVWYVLAEPTTGIVNEPLRKIGDYADSVSGTNLSVTAQSPTTIDVDTTLKPSEMDLIYTGLKMCGRKKYVHGDSPQVMPSAAAETKELNGITVTCDGKGTYTISGTASEYASIVFNIPEFTTPISIGQGGNGTLSFFNTFDTNKTQIAFYYNSTRVDDWVCTPLNRTNTVYSAVGNKTINKITFNVSGGTSVQGTVSPMFTNDGQLPSTYQSYLQWQ